MTGKEAAIALTEAELSEVNKHLVSVEKVPLTSNSVMSYSKLVVDRQTIQSQAMSRAKRSNSHTVSYSKGSQVAYGLLDKLIQVKSAETYLRLALINRLEVLNRPTLPSSHDLTETIIKRLLEDFVYVKETNVLTVVAVDNILMQCFNTSVTGNCCMQLTHCINSVENIL